MTRWEAGECSRCLEPQKHGKGEYTEKRPWHWGVPAVPRNPWSSRAKTHSPEKSTNAHSVFSAPNKLLHTDKSQIHI